MKQVRAGPIRDAPGSESGMTRVPPARVGEWAARPSGRPGPPGGARARGGPAPSGARTAAVLLLAAVLVTGCGGSGPGTATDPEPPGNELAERGEPCPGALVAEPPDQRPAESNPDLVAADEAWACAYRSRGRDGEWRRVGDAVALDREQLDAAEGELAALEPAPVHQMCTADLGPRYVLVLSSGGDLTSVVLDDFGCHTVRVSDDLPATAPGEGEVPGRFSLPTTLVEQLARAVDE